MVKVKGKFLLGFAQTFFADIEMDPIFVFRCIVDEILTLEFQIIKLFIEINLSSSTAVIRTFRVGRIFKLLKKNKNLRVLFKTLIDAIPQLTNVGGIMLLILFIYSILGVSLFGKVML